MNSHFLFTHFWKFFKSCCTSGWKPAIDDTLLFWVFCICPSVLLLCSQKDQVWMIRLPACIIRPLQIIQNVQTHIKLKALMFDPPIWTLSTKNQVWAPGAHPTREEVSRWAWRLLFFCLCARLLAWIKVLGFPPVMPCFHCLVKQISEVSEFNFLSLCVISCCCAILSFCSS